MNKYIPAFILAIAAFMLVAPAYGEKPMAKDETARVESATTVLSEIMSAPEGGIPKFVLDQAYGVAVIPGQIKAAAGIGGYLGNGVLVAKSSDGNWSAPAFISMTGGSMGVQAGFEESDVILVFKTAKSVEAVGKGSFALGAAASVVAGPVGHNAEATSDAQTKATIYSYSRNKGLFAGVSLEGSSLKIDNKANVAFYDRPGITFSMILDGKRLQEPGVAKKFTCTLASYTNTKMKMCG